jgi:hypothetical protein
MLSLKTDVNVPTVSNKQDNLVENTYFLLAYSVPYKAIEKRAGSGCLNKWYRSAGPDPYQNVTDREHCH